MRENVAYAGRGVQYDFLGVKDIAVAVRVPCYHGMNSVVCKPPCRRACAAASSRSLRFTPTKPASSQGEPLGAQLLDTAALLQRCVAGNGGTIDFFYSGACHRRLDRLRF